MTGVNAPLPSGDPVVAEVQTLGAPLPGPFAGQAINCRSCHFVTEFQGVTGAGNRTYSDFTTRSPIPRTQPNGFDHTPRNSMQMVDSFTSRSGPLFLHFDGEFATGEDLVIGTMTGRNFGWLPSQYNEALAHIAKVIREDDGSGQLAADRLDGLSYSVIFKGTDPRITPDLLLPPAQRLDVSTATDEQVAHEIAICIAQYMKDLLFQRDSFGRYIGSPYDNFLRVNHLPQAAPGGTDEGGLQPESLSAGVGTQEPDLHHGQRWFLRISCADLPVRRARTAGAEDIPRHRRLRAQLMLTPAIVPRATRRRTSPTLSSITTE